MPVANEGTKLYIFMKISLRLGRKESPFLGLSAVLLEHILLISEIIGVTGGGGGGRGANYPPKFFVTKKFFFVCALLLGGK
jgi:hypothetical protein